MPPQQLDELFTRRAANAAGLSDRALAREVRADGLERVRRGIYGIPGAVPDPVRDALAASLAYPDLPLSHLSSAVVRAIPVVGVRISCPDMTVAPRGAGNIRDVHAYRARLREHDVEIVQGRPCTSAARTVVDIARHYPSLTAVAAIDHVLHHHLATPEQLRDVLDFSRGWPGAPRARQALLLSDSRAESPLESVSRLVIPRLGLPTPEPQVRILDADDHVVARLDFFWDALGVGGEADGRSKYNGRETLIEEKRRERALRDLGLELARWYWEYPWSRQEALRNEIASAFRRAAARDRAGLPRGWKAVGTPRLAVL